MNKAINKTTALFMFIFIGLGALFAGDVTFFGPRQYTRNTGKPVTEAESFTCPPGYMGSGFTLRLVNGDSQGNNRVSSAEIKINGVQVMGPSNFNQKVGIIERTVSLKAVNEISVILNSKPGGYVIIDIYKFITEPAATFTAAPDSIRYGESATLSWAVSNADTVTIDNGIGSVGAAGTRQVSPGVPTTTYTLTGANLGGTTIKQAVVAVAFPMPTVAFSASPVIIRPGVSSALTWTTYAAHTVTIGPGIGNVAVNGNLAVSPGQTVTYLLTAVGYGGTQTAAAEVIVDGIAPVVEITAPQNNARVREIPITISGVVTEDNLLKVLLNNAVEGAVSGSGFTFNNVPLNLGENTLTVTAEDKAGNTGSMSITVRYIPDSEPPEITIVSPGDNVYINTPEVVVSGVVGDQSAIGYVKVNGRDAQLNGLTFSYTLALAEGENTIIVESADEYQNKGTVSLTITRDTSAPVLEIAAPQNNIVTDKDKITVSGKIIDAYPLKVTAQDTGNTGNSFEGEIIGNNFYFRDMALREGVNTVQFSVRDRAGNINQTPCSLTVVRDSVIPQLTILYPVSGAVLSQRSVVVRGTVVDEHLKEVRVNYRQCPLLSNEFSLAVPLVEGVNTIEITALDTAGNIAEKSLQVTVDTVLPNLNIYAPLSNAIVNTPSISVSGRVDDVRISSVKVNGEAAVLNGNLFDVNNVMLQEGLNTIIVEVLDGAGNRVVSNVSVALDTKAPEIVSVVPADRAMGAPLTTEVQVTFSEAVDPATLNDQTFYLTKSFSGVKGAVFQKSPLDYLLRPSEPLPDGSEIVIHITGGVKDLAGNSLADPYTGSFFTRDMTAPDAPMVDPLPEKTGLGKITVKGTAEKDALVSVSGGFSRVETRADGQGTFSMEVSLNPNQLNQLCVTAADASGNVGIPTCIAVAQEQREFVVTDARFENNQVRVTFSRTIDAAGLTASAFSVSSARGVESGTISVSADNTTAIFTPTADLSTQTIMLEVKSGVKDSEGISLSVPFTRVFNASAQGGGGDVIVQGEVYDDGTGLPLAGAVVKLVSVDGAVPSEPAPAAITTGEGKYVLVIPSGQCILRVGKEGYTRSMRAALSVPGFSSQVFDSRLTPLSVEEKILTSAGGSITNEGAVLVYPDGTVDSEKKVFITPVGPQGLLGRLPSGWSPLFAYDLRLSEGELLKPCQLRSSLIKSFTGSRGGFSKEPLAAGGSSNILILAFFDETTFQWKAASTVSVSPEEINGTIDKQGQYAFLIMDTAPIAPAQPVIDEPIAGVSQGAVPTEITAALTFNPTAIYPGDTSTAILVITPATTTPNTPNTGISSGAPVQAKINENYNLSTGSKTTFTPYTADLTAYNYGASAAVVEFNLSPNSSISAAEIKIGTIKSDMIRYSAGAMGIVVGTAGGTVNGGGGAEVVIQPGAAANPIVVSVSKIDAAALDLPAPAGFEAVGALELSLGGATLGKSAAISLPLTAEELNSIPQNAQLLIVKLEKIDYQLTWVLKTQAKIENSRITGFNDGEIVNSGLPFPGITQGGVYLFLKAGSPAGFITGVVTKETQPLSGAVVSVDRHEIKSLTSAVGNYVQTGFTGAAAVSALNLFTRDEGSGNGTIQSAAEVITLNITIQAMGPQIVSMTPMDNAIGVPLNSKITLIFSKPLRAATYNAQSVFVTHGAQRVNGVLKLSGDAKQGEFIPNADFPSDSMINITVTTGLQDVYGVPMGQVFTSTFRTVDIIPPRANFNNISIEIPVNGAAKVTGLPGSVEEGSTVFVFNERTGENKSQQCLSMGDFSIMINAEIGDRLQVTILDGNSNKTILPFKPFTADNGRIVVMDSRALEYITPTEGLGIKVEEGTFSEPVMVGLYKETDPQVLAPMAEGFQRLAALRVDFGGVIPNKPFKLSIPTPPAPPDPNSPITADSQLFIAREVDIFGQKKLMVVDTAALKDNNTRIETNSPPWPGCTAEGIYTMMINSIYQLSYITGMMGSANAAVMCMDLVFITGGPQFIMPIPINRNVTLTARDLTTGETIFKQDLTGPTMQGQVYNFGVASNDKECPTVTGVTGLSVMSFDVTGRIMESRGISGITITPQFDDGMVNSILIEGREGTAAAINAGALAPLGKVRVYQLQESENEETGDKTYIELTTGIIVQANGSFSGAVAAKKGDRLIITVEKGDIPLDPEFLVTFSEPLDSAYTNGVTSAYGSVPIEIYEVGEGGSEVKRTVYTKLLASGTEVTVKIAGQLKESTQYKMKFAGVLDRSGNSLEMTCEFRSKGSRRFYSLEQMEEVYDTLLVGGRLFVAAGYQGIKVYDVSNPAAIKYILTKDLNDVARGLGLYIGAGGVKYLAAVGGGSIHKGFIKVFDISSLFAANANTIPDLVQIKTQAISDPLGGDLDSGLLNGHPREVSIVDNYAFIAVQGGGLMIVDIQRMKEYSTGESIIGCWNQDEYVTDVRAFKKTDSAGVTRFYAALLINYYGVKILDVTDPDKPMEWGRYQVPSRRLLMGLEVAQDFWVDIDSDGRQGRDEDNDNEKDLKETPLKRNVTAKDESRDLLFFTIPIESKICMIDFSKHTGGDLFIKKVIPLQDAWIMGELVLDEEEQVLYVADHNLGLALVDVSFPGDTFEISGGENQRVLGHIHTTGVSRFGLAIDKELHTAYIGQMDKGVDAIKLANPEIKLVYKYNDTYREVSKIAPVELRERDNTNDPLTGQPYPGEIYIMALLPGGIGLPGDVENGQNFVEASLWSLNKYENPIVPWDKEIKTYIKKVRLYRQSNQANEDKYRMFLSRPIKVMLNPSSADSGAGDVRLLSGDIIWAHLSEKVYENLVSQAAEGTVTGRLFLTRNDCVRGGDKKPSIRAEYVDRLANLDKQQEEKPNSPVNNPAVYANVFLHSGEFFQGNVDLQIPGRGFDFAFNWTYRSQCIYSGVLGWGWDHNYNKRLVEMLGGDILYYDGAGRRERYEAIKQNNIIKAYKAPAGWFTELKKCADGSFTHKFSDGVVEFFDAYGSLVKIQDRNRNKMEFFYDMGGQLTAVMDTMGRLIEFEYYPFEMEPDETGEPNARFKVTSGRLKQIIDFSGRQLKFNYDSLTGDLLEADFGGRVTRYTYSSGADIQLAHNLRTVTDPKEQTVLTINYTETGDKVLSINAGGSTTQFTVGDTSASVIDGRGNTKQFTLDSGHIVSINEGLTQPPTQFEYTTTNGLLQRVTYPRGNAVRYDYNKNLVTTITEEPTAEGVNDPEYPVEPNRTTQFQYDDFTYKLTGITYPEGLTQKYSYNQYGQPAGEFKLIGSNTVPIGMARYYEYYPESNPGGSGPVESPRSLDQEPGGGYLKRSFSSYGYNQSLGLWEEYTHDLKGNLTTVNSSDGIDASYQVNSFNELEQETITSPGSESMSPLYYSGAYTYDKNGNLETENISSGSISKIRSYTYDTRNNMVAENDSSNGLTTYTYDPTDNITSISGPRGTMAFNYDARGMIDTSAFGNETYRYTYDENGNINTVINPYGYVTTHGYDGYNRLSQIKDPLNNETLIGRTQFGNMQSIKKLDSAQTILRHTIQVNDPLGRMASYTVKMPGDADIIYTYTYEDNGKTIIIKDPLGRESKVYKDDYDRVKQEIDAAGNITDYYYEDGRGNMTKKVEIEKSADGTITETYVTQYKYNDHNKVETITDPKGHQTFFYYNKMGNLTGTRDAEGNIITHEYDQFGQKIKTTQELGNGQKIVTTFEYYPPNTYNPKDKSGQYSPAGQLKSITDDKGNKTSYEYDNQNRIKKIVYPDSSVAEYSYDKEAGPTQNGDPVYYRVVTEKQRNGNVVKHYYDGLQRLIKNNITPAEGVDGTTLETFVYDGLSRLRSAVDDDAAIEYGYDPAGRKTWGKQMGKLIEYTHDKANNPLSVKYPNSRVIEREFDPLNRIKKIREGVSGIAEMNHIGRSFRLLSKQYGNGDLISYLYDNGRRLTGLESKNKNSDLINKYVYGYNRVGMKMFEQRGHNDNKGDAFSYDGVYRLTGVKFNSPEPQNPATTLFEKQKAINLDKVYNIMSIVETENNQTTREIFPLIQQGSDNAKLNQYTEFDGWGLSYDLNGNITQKGTQHFTYDYRNQLVRAVGVDTTTDFKYDPLGHRIKKIVSTGSQGKTSQYFYDGNQLIEERDGNDNVLKQYIYGYGIDEIIRMDKYEGATVTSYYFHTDANGSVTSITDKDGNLVERVTYDTYGMPTFWNPAGNVIPESLIGNTILFQGREYDKETNLYYYRARYYDPIMGRFLQTDPMGYQDSMNLYQGFNMNPVNFWDPMGLEWFYSKKNLGELGGEWDYFPGIVRDNESYRFLLVVQKSKNYYNPGTTKTEYFDIVFYDNDKKIASMENAFSGGTIEDGKEYDAIPKCNYYGMLDEIDSKGPQEKAKDIPNLVTYEGIQKIPNRELPGIGDNPSDTWNPYSSYGPIRLRLHPFNGKKWRIYFHGQNPVHGDTHGCLSYGTNTDIINKLWNLAETTPKKDKLKVVFAVDVKVNEPIRSAK